MTRSLQWMGTTSAIALAIAPTVAQAAAVGTAVNTTISNTVSVTYSVGGTAQTAVAPASPDQFKVDRKINLTVTTQDSAAVTVAPKQTNAVTTFTVTNSSNDSVGFLLTATQQSSGASKFSTSNDTINVELPKIYVETNGTAGWQTTDTEASSLAAIASGNAATVYIVAKIPDAAVQDDIATVILTAQAAYGVTATTGNAGTGGTAYTQTSSSTANDKMNTVDADTVFADAQAETATGDGLRDGKHAARSDYKVDTAALKIQKVSRVHWDPYNLFTNPRAIPGAIVEYCIVVKNESTTVDATDVKISDTIDTSTLTSISVPTIGGTYTASTSTCAGGTAGTWGSTAGDIYEYTLGTVAKNTTSLVSFQATIK